MTSEEQALVHEPATPRDLLSSRNIILEEEDKPKRSAIPLSVRFDHAQLLSVLQALIVLSP